MAVDRLFVGLAVAGTVLVTFGACLWPYRTACVYEIPEGFHGWVLIEFENRSCPALPIRDGKLVFSVSAQGSLCASSKLEQGWATDEYFFVGQVRTPIPNTGWGGGGLIWGSSNGWCQVTGKVPHVFESFFVGTETQFRAAGAPPELEGCKT